MSKDKHGIETKYYQFNEVPREYISKTPMQIWMPGSGRSPSTDRIWREINDERQAIRMAGFKVVDTNC